MVKLSEVAALTARVATVAQVTAGAHFGIQPIVNLTYLFNKVALALHAATTSLRS